MGWLSQQLSAVLLQRCVLQPPELHPYNFPELMIAPLSPLTEHDNQVCVMPGR
jgi:hypothetical protein